MAYALLQERTKTTMLNEFEFEFDKTRITLQETMSNSIFSAKIVRSLLQFVVRRNMSAALTRTEWEAFVAQLSLVRQGVHAIIYSRYVPYAEKEAFEEANKDNYPNFRIRERAPNGMMVPVPPRPAYQVVQFATPLAGNEDAIGLDSYSTDSNATFRRAREIGEPQVSERFTLVQGSEPGVIVSVPAYNATEIPDTVEERRRLYIGSGVGSFKIRKLIASALYATAQLDQSQTTPTWNCTSTFTSNEELTVPKTSLWIAVMDMSAINNEEQAVLLYADNATEFESLRLNTYISITEPLHGIIMQTNVTVGDRKWMIVGIPRDSFFEKFAVELQLPLIVLLCTIAAAATLCCYLAFSLRSSVVISNLLNEKSALLDQILPPEISKRVARGEDLIAESVPAACILFADIVNFTALSSSVSPPSLIRMLSSLFSQFDALLEIHQVEKIKTIGDAYLACAGLYEGESSQNPILKRRNAEALVRFAFAMQEIIDSVTIDELPDTRLQLRIGIHCGPVVAGVIGKKKPCFDIWGDAVNVTSRLESTGIPGKIQVSQEIKDILEQPTVIETTETKTVYKTLHHRRHSIDEEPKISTTATTTTKTTTQDMTIDVDLPDITLIHPTATQARQSLLTGTTTQRYRFEPRELNVKGKGKMMAYIIYRTDALPSPDEPQSDWTPSMPSGSATPLTSISDQQCGTTEQAVRITIPTNCATTTTSSTKMPCESHSSEAAEWPTTSRQQAADS